MRRGADGLLKETGGGAVAESARAAVPTIEGECVKAEIGCGTGILFPGYVCLRVSDREIDLRRMFYREHQA